jgi:putative nucleotidyltransferase with HDIG domain
VCFVVASALLAVVFAVVTISVRNQVRQSVQSMLESGQRVLAELEALHQQDVRAQASILAESPALKTALEAYAAGRPPGGASDRALSAVGRELDRLAGLVTLDAIVIVDTHQHTLVAAGPRAAEWPRGPRVAFTARARSQGRTDGIIHRGDRVYRAVWRELAAADAPIGTLYVVSLLDERFATELARVSNASIAIVSKDRLVASTLTPAAAGAFVRTLEDVGPSEGSIVLGRESFHFRRLLEVADVAVYALGSIDGLSRTAMRRAMQTIGFIALGTTALALLGSIWMAHLLTGPVGRLSHALRSLSASRDSGRQLPRTGSSRELDMLVDTFNELMASRAAAEAETEAAYTGAIRALAAALDARDPYTAGHSERVSTVSVAIGRTLGLPEADVEVLRLGALLHDIGKIGVPDGVLRKTGPLTADEYALIKRHPELGARILQSVPFLAAHLPIVELHHEQPDGRGYPYSLQGHTTPLLARIVHVADAYDAMTSARAYRGARSSTEAMRELWRGAGSQFDSEIVEALAVSLSAAPAAPSEITLRVVHA